VCVVVVSDDPLMGEIDFSHRNAPKFLTSTNFLYSKIVDGATAPGSYLAAIYRRLP
jgi:hypothetical protein